MQQRDGGGSSVGDDSLVTARRLRHLAAARWRRRQHGDSLAAAAQRWKWRRHYGNSLAAGGFCSLAQAARRGQLGRGSSAKERGRWRQRRQKSIVFVHINKSAAPGCKCLATLLKGKLPVHDCHDLCCYYFRHTLIFGYLFCLYRVLNTESQTFNTESVLNVR